MCVNPSSVLQAGAQVMQGVADYQAGNANAKLAHYEGRSAMDAANLASQQIADQGAKVLGQTHAAQAASGVDMTTGNAADVSAESASNIELDRLNALYGGQLKKWSKNIEASQYKVHATAGLVTGALDAGGSLLTGTKW